MNLGSVYVEWWMEGDIHSVSVCQDWVADKKRRCSPDSNSEVKCAFFEADQGDRVGHAPFYGEVTASLSKES